MRTLICDISTGSAEKQANHKDGLALNAACGYY